MEEFKCRGYAGDIPVYCAHDKFAVCPFYIQVEETVHR